MSIGLDSGFHRAWLDFILDNGFRVHLCDSGGIGDLAHRRHVFISSYAILLQIRHVLCIIRREIIDSCVMAACGRSSHTCMR